MSARAWRVCRVVLNNQGAISGIGGFRDIGDPYDRRRSLGGVPIGAVPPGLSAAPGYVIGASRPLGDPFAPASTYPRADVLLGRGDPEAAALPLLWQSGPSVPSGTRQALSEADKQPGLVVDAAVAANPVLFTPRASRRAPENQPGMLVRQADRGPGLINPLLQRPRQDSRLTAYEVSRRPVTSQRTISNPIEGEWTYAPQNEYIPGENRAFERRQLGLPALLAGETDQITLVDPRIAPRTAVSQWSFPPSSPGPRPAGVINAAELVGYPGDGPNLPLVYGELLTEYARGIPNGRIPVEGTRVIDPSKEGDLTEFTSEDPTLLQTRRGSVELNPFGMVSMPAVRPTGRVTGKGLVELVNRDRSGRQLVASIDPTAIAEVRVGNPDATYASDRIDEVSVGRLAQELSDEYATRVLTGSRLNELYKQGRVRLNREMPGSAVGEVQLWDGSWQTIYQPTDQQGNPLTTVRGVPEGRDDVRLVQENLYRIGNPQNRDNDAIRAALQPYITGSRIVGVPARVSSWDLDAAEKSGYAQRVTGKRIMDPAGRMQFVEGGGPDAQTYVRYGDNSLRLLVPRRRATGEVIPNQFLVGEPTTVYGPTGPTPFLVPPAAPSEQATPAEKAAFAERAALIGGIRSNNEKTVLQRNGRTVPLGESFNDTLRELIAGAYSLGPTQRSGMEDILGALAVVRQQALDGGATPQDAERAVSLAAQEISRLSAPGQKSGEPNQGPVSQTSLQRIRQAMREQAGAREVDLFAEQPIAPRDAEFAQLYQDELNGRLAELELRQAVDPEATLARVAPPEDEANLGGVTTDDGSRSAYGDFGMSVRVVNAGDEAAVQNAFTEAVSAARPQATAAEAAYLAEIAQRTALSRGDARPQWNPAAGRFETPVATGLRLIDPAAAVAAIADRPVTTRNPARGDRQLAINLGGAGYRPYVRTSVDAGPRELDVRVPGESYGAWSLDQLRLPLGGAPTTAAPAAPSGESSVPDAVRAGLAKDPSHPARIAAEKFLAARRAAF